MNGKKSIHTIFRHFYLLNELLDQTSKSLWKYIMYRFTNFWVKNMEYGLGNVH